MLDLNYLNIRPTIKRVIIKRHNEEPPETNEMYLLFK